MFYQHKVYVQVFENRFECLFWNTGKRKTVVSEKPFSSDKLLVADFDLADKVLRDAIRSNKRWRLLMYFIRESLIVIHQRDQANELCPTEIKILEQLAYGSGAGFKAAYVWQGKELSISELENGAYKNS